MKLLAALFTVILATPVAFAQELEEAPGAAPMNTAPPPSNEELNEAVDTLSHEKAGDGSARSAPRHAPLIKATPAKKIKAAPAKHAAKKSAKAVKRKVAAKAKKPKGKGKKH
jgi:hypothetical protein